MTVDPKQLNEAMWAACNTRLEITSNQLTMEQASEIGLNAVQAYLGLNQPEHENEWAEAIEAIS